MEINKGNQNTLSKDTRSCIIYWADNIELKNITNLTNLKRIYITHDAKNKSDMSALQIEIPTYYSTYLAPNKKRKRHLRRTMFWAKKNKVSPIIEDVTANTYSAVTLMAKSIKHISNNFSRDYLVERLEHLIDNSDFHSIYNSFSLGPDQRYASKGAYIIGPTNILKIESHPNNYKWIIP